MSDNNMNVLLIKDGERIYLADVNFGGLARDSTLQQTNDILSNILNQVAKDDSLNNLLDFLKKPYSSIFKKYQVNQDFSDTIVESANCIRYLKIVSTLNRGNLVIKIGDTTVLDVDLSDVKEVELNCIAFFGNGSIEIKVSNVTSSGNIYLWLSYR